MSKRVFRRNARNASPELRTDLGLSLSIDAPVLISGDVTSAKRMALAIHQRGGRSQGPFIAVSCGRDEAPFSKKAEVDLLAAGRLASGGTLFVEHVDRTSPSLQHELMLVLEMTSEPATPANRGVGGARVVVASSGDLYERVLARDFREDLFYRLNVIHLKVPDPDAARLPAMAGAVTLAKPSLLVSTTLTMRNPPAPAVAPALTSAQPSDSEKPTHEVRSATTHATDDRLCEFPAEGELTGETRPSAPAREVLAAPEWRVGDEWIRARRRLRRGGKRLAWTIHRGQRAVWRQLSSTTRTVPLVPFVSGMLVGGSLVFMGASSGDQLGSRALLSTVPVVERQEPASPVEQPEEPSGASSSGGTIYRSSLEIGSEPSGARVYLNNQMVGTTPLELNGLPVGSRVLRMERPGYETWSTAVMVTTERRTRVAVDLRPSPASD